MWLEEDLRPAARDTDSMESSVSSAQPVEGANGDPPVTSLRMSSSVSLKNSQQNIQQLERDLYGLEIRADIVDEYNKFVYDGNYMLKLQEQNERFDRFMAELEPILESEECTDLQSLAARHPQLHETLSQLVEDGIPSKYRKTMWEFFSGTKHILDLSTGIYQAILAEHEHDSTEAITQIHKDVKRTFVAQNYNEDSIRRVLVAYSYKNPVLGYCQSMNFICAGLLVFMPEESAFWMLGYIVEKLFPSYFDKTLTGFEVDARVLRKYLKRRLPKLYKHFKRIDFNIRTVTVQWFMCLYVTSLPYEVAFRIWDVLFFRGQQIMLEVAIGIFTLLEKQLLTLEDDTELGLCLTKEVAKLFDASVLMNVKRMRLPKLDETRAAVKSKVSIAMQNAVFERQKCELAMIVHFTPAELDALQAQFMQLEGSVRGISLEAFVEEFLLKLAPDLAWNQSNFFTMRMFELFVDKNSNMLDFRGLVRLLSTFFKGTIPEKQHLCYEIFAIGGEVDRDNLTKVLLSIYHLYNQNDCEQEVNFFVDMIFQISDEDKDGKLREPEFANVSLMQPLIAKLFQLDNPKLSRKSIDLANIEHPKPAKSLSSFF